MDVVLWVYDTRAYTYLKSQQKGNTMEEIKYAEELVRQYGPTALEKVQNVAFITGSINIATGSFCLLALLVMLFIAYKKGSAFMKAIEEEPVLLIFIVYTATMLSCFYVAAKHLPNMWNYVALYDSETWAAHRVLEIINK